MSPPSATLAHAGRGRARFRVHGLGRSPEWFDAAERTLRECPGVLDVVARPLTRSIILLHDRDVSEIVQFAEKKELFVVAPSASAQPTILAEIQGEIARLEERLRSRSDGRVGLDTLGFYTLLGASGLQLVRGQYLPTAGALLLNAIGVLGRGAEASRGARREPLPPEPPVGRR